MFDRLLIPYPPDSPDVNVATYGIELAQEFGADVTVLSIVDQPQKRDQIRSDPEADAREATDSVLELAEDRQLRGDRVITEGQAAEEIINAVAEHNIDLVVMGTQARTGVDRVILGSVAESVVRQSPVPVMTVTPDASAKLEMPTNPR